jgi:hypothetical protein
MLKQKNKEEKKKINILLTANALTKISNKKFKRQFLCNIKKIEYEIFILMIKILFLNLNYFDIIYFEQLCKPNYVYLSFFEIPYLI